MVNWKAIVITATIVAGGLALHSLQSNLPELEASKTPPPSPSVASSTPRPRLTTPLSENPKRDLSGHLENADRALHGRDYKSAEAHFNEVLAQDDKNETALVQLGVLYAHDPSRQEEAEALLKRALVQNPENEMALEELLYLHEEAGTPEEALRIFGELYQANSSSPVVSSTYARALARQGRYDEAIRLLRKSAKTPELAESSLLTLTDVYRRMNNPRILAQTYSQLVTLQERMLGRGIEDNEQAQSLKLDIVLNKVAWADSLLDSHDVNGAQKILNGLLETSPENPAVKSLAARIQSRQVR